MLQFALVFYLILLEPHFNLNSFMITGDSKWIVWKSSANTAPGKGSEGHK